MYLLQKAGLPALLVGGGGGGGGGDRKDDHVPASKG